MRNIIIIGMFLLATSMYMSSCAPAGGENPGHEYMPDMFHSTAYEANTYDYYYYNTWGTEEEYKKYAMPRKPVAGTIPRGYAGMKKGEGAAEFLSDFESMPINGSVPYHYEDTEDERIRAMAEITSNPFPITAGGLVRGKALYDIYCGICHGTNGDGMGYLAREDGGKYPAAPANFLLPDFVSSSEGRYYHSIIYGKNVMGGYADKLSFEERWQVIHYIRSLQAKEAGLQYDEDGNTLNNGAVALADWNLGVHSSDDMPETVHPILQAGEHPVINDHESEEH